MDTCDSHDAPSGGSAAGGTREMDDYSDVDEYGDGGRRPWDRWATVTENDW